MVPVGISTAPIQLDDQAGTLICRKRPEWHILDDREVQLDRSNIRKDGIFVRGIADREQESGVPKKPEERGPDLPSEHKLKSPEGCCQAQPARG